MMRACPKVYECGVQMAKLQADAMLNNGFGPFEPRTAAVVAMFAVCGGQYKAVKEFESLRASMIDEPKLFILTWCNKFNRTWSFKAKNGNEDYQPCQI
jgi:hypothetical protein